MPNIILGLLLLLMMISSGCNNPSGGSIVAQNHTPLLKPPAAFKYTQVRAVDGTVSLKWQSSERADNYKVYQGTNNTTVTTPVASCNGNILTCTITGLDPSTLLYFSVTSSNAAGTKNITAIAPALSVSAFDTTGSSAADGQLNVTWGASTGATSYNILYGTNSGSYSNSVNGVTTPYSLTGLSNGQTYYVRIVAVNAYNGYALSDSEENGQPFGPPAVPTGLTLAATPGQIALNWNSVSGANTYKVFRGTSSGSLTEIANGILSTNYTDTATTDGTTYFYALKGYNGYDSVISSEASARSISAFNISSVTVGPAAAQLTITWPTTTGASGYDIKYGTNPASLNLTASSVTSPHVLSGLTGGSTYYAKVVAKNTVGLGTSLNSTNQLSATPIVAIAAPTGITATATPGQIVLNWNTVAGASSYEVLRGTVTGTYASLQASIVGNTYTDTAVSNGTAYFYVVRSFNGFNSVNSLEVTKKSIQSFSIASVTPASTTSLQISWAAAAGADAYDVRYGTVSGTYTGTATGVTSPYTLTGLVANTSYYVVVKARNAIGTGTIFQTAQDSGKTKTAAPTGLAATTTPSQVSLNWTNVVGASTYSVYRGTVTGTYSLLISGLATSDYIDTSVVDGTTYFYVARSSNGSESANSSEVSARTIASFSITGTSTPSVTSMLVTWPAAAGAATYDIQYGTVSGTYTTTVTGRTSPSTLTGLTSGVTYYLRVIAKNAVGAGSTEYSNQVSQGIPVGPPTGVLATVANDQITISWTAVSGASSYKLYRGTVSGTFAEIANSIATTNYVDTSVVDGTAYYYVLRSYNGTDSSNSSEVSGKTITDFAITSLNVVSPTSLQATFPTTIGGDLYDVRYGTTSGTYTTTLSAVTSPYTITGLTANTTYYVVARARNVVGSGGNRSTAEVSLKTPVSAPTALVATAVSAQVNLIWTAAAGATSYKVYRGTVSGTHSLLASGVATTSYSDATATNGTTYFYVVKSFNGSDSANSLEVSSRPIEDFAIASISSPSSTTIQVSWPAVSGASTYDVRYGTSTGTYTTTVTGQTSPYTIIGLTANTTYYIVIKAKNTIGTGSTVSSTEGSQKTATGTPAGLVASATPGQVGLNWTATTGAASYKVYRGTAAGTYSEIANNVATNAYLDTTVTDGTTYFYAIKANNGSDSAYSNEVSIRSINTFNFTAATTASSTSASLTWDAAAGAATYDVRYGTSSGVYLTTASSVTSPYTLTGLTANTTYYISIRAKNAIGTGTNYNSNELTLTTSTAAPTAVVATANTTSQIDLTWVAASGATNYKILRGTISGTYAQIASGVSGTTYSDTTVTNGTTYFYVIKSFNGADSANSNESSAQPIASFSVTSTTAPTTTTVQVTWPATTGATLYDVRYGTVSGTYTTTVASVTSPYTITGLASGTTYYVVVRARNAIGGTAAVSSAEVSQITPIGAPTGLIATASPGSVGLSWTAAGGATNYKIYRGTVSGTYSLLVSGNVPTSYSDATAVDGTTYYYVIKSFNGADSANSSEVSVRTISNFTIASTSSPTSTTAIITWSAVPGAATYDVRYGTSTGSYTTTLSSQTSPYTITGLAANTTYFIAVRANNAVGAGSTITSTETSQKTATATPTGLVASTTPGQVGLNWTATTGAASYSVYRGTSTGVRSLLASGVTTNAYLDTTVVDGTSYFYTVRAFNGSASLDSSEVSIRSISSFSLTAVTATSATSIGLTWGAATGAATYDVRYGTSTGVYSGTVIGQTSPYTLTGLTANTSYYISIRANNTIGTGTYYDSNEMITTTSTAAPTALVATATNGQIDLSWTAAGGATNYKIMRGTVSGTYAQIASGVSGANYSDTTIANGTQYFYVVKAFNGSDSVNSNEATGKSIAGFTITSTTAPTTSTVQVTWPATSGAATYDVRYGTSTGSYGTTVTSVTSPYTISGLTGGTTYYVVVRAVNGIGSGTSTTSTEVSQITPLAAPTGLAATSTPGSVALTWSAVAGATNYKIYRGTSTGSYSSLATGNVPTSFTDSTVVNGTSYFYVVKAFNGADSANSSEVTTRPIHSFFISSATALTASSIHVTWTPAAGAATYDIKYGTTSGTYTTTLSSQTNPTTVTGLSPGSTYYFVVVAKNAIGLGTSVNSAEVGATTAFGAPAGLAATAVPGQVNLSWTNVSGATSYKILRGTTTGSYTEIDSGIGTNAYSDITAINGTTYFYAVRAYNGTDSANSNEATIRAISSFTFTSAITASSSSIDLVWGSATGAATYDVRYGSATGTYGSSVISVTSPYTLTGLTAGTTYYFSVRAKNTVGSGTNYDSSELNAKTSPSAASGLIAAATTGQIALSWTATSGATSYNIYRGTVSGTYAQIASANVPTTYTDSTVTNGTQYYYVVRGHNGTEAANSNEATGKSIAGFTITSTTAPTTSTIQVTWPASVGATTYDVRYGTSTGSYGTTATSVTSPYTITGLTGGTNYYIVVRAVNTIGAGSTATSAEVSQVTPLAAPTGLAASSTPGSVALTWSAVAGATNYKIYRGTSTGSYSSLATGNVPTSYTDATAVNGTTYFYVVKAYNGADSADSNEISTRPIANFAIASTTSPSASTIQVTWSAPSGGATYDVRYGTATGSYSTTITGQTSPYTITGLSAGTTYYLAIKANNAIGAGTTVTSSESSQLIALIAPTGLAATTTPGSAALTWGAVAGATSYKIYRGTVSGTRSLIASGNVPASYTDATVTDGTTYYYTVRAINGSDSADSSEIAVQSISNFAFTSATTASSASIDLVWASASGAATYDVRYGTVSGTYGSSVTSVTSPYTLTGLNAGTTYYFSVRAKNAVGSGTNYDSSELNAKTSPSAASGLLAAATTGQIALSWTATSGATNYNIYRGTSSGTYTQIASANVATTYTDSTVANGTQYYYVVRGYNGNESANSNEATGKSIAAFTITSTTAPTTSTIQVTWPAVSGATTYDVRYGTATGSYSTTVTSQTSPYTISGLTGGTSYYIVVRAVNATGSGSTATSAEVSQVTPLGAPTGLAATSTPGSVALTWSAVAGATNYKIYRGTVSGTYSSLATGNAPTSYTDATAVNGTTYFYVVKAFNGADSVNSNEVTTQPIANFAIASTSSPSSTSVQVTWSAPTGGATYDVRYGTATGSYTTTVSGQTSPYTITGLTAGTTYYLAIRANNAIGTGTSVTSSESTQLTALGAPTGFVASATPGQVGLNWNAMGGASSYKVYRGTSSGVRSLLASGVAGAAYVDTTVTNGTTYYYTVRAFNGTDSADSSEIAVQSISTFSLTAATAASATSINLTWGSATGAATYYVRYGTSTGVYLGTVTGATSPYTLTGLTSGTTYFISIQARNTIGAGTLYNSNELNAKTAVGVPTGLAVVATPGNAALSWTTVSGATNYNIYRGTVSGTYSQIASAVGATSYNDNTVVNGTTYYYMVRAYNGIESANSGEASVQTISVFSLTAATATSASTIDVTWGSATGAATYDVRYGTSSGNYSTTLTGLTSPYTLTGLSAATPYYIVIRANNAVGSGTSYTSNEMTATTSTIAPTTLVANAITGQVNLTWSASAGAATYRVYRGTVSGTYVQIATGIAVTNYSDTTVATGTSYYYVVRGYNGSESANSNEAMAATVGAFSISSTTPLSTTSIQVAWGAASGATDYDVRYGTSTTSYTTTVASVTSPYTMTGLTAGQTYYIIVRARNTIGGGSTANTSEVSQITPALAPTALVATGGAGQISLSWTAAAGASTYKIMRGTVSGTYAQIASGVSGTSYTDSTAANGTTYYYAVKSFNGADSVASSEVFKQPIAAPSISSINGNSTTTLLVTWGAATGSTSFDLKYGTTSGSYSTTVTGATSPYSITGLTTGVAYYIQIVAKNTIGGGTSVNSTESSGAPNSAPVLSSISAQSMEADSAFGVAFTLSDNNHILSCAGAMSATSSNTAVLLNAGIVFSGTLPNCTATVTPVASQTGATTITITATDGISPVSQNFVMTVTPCTVAYIQWETQPTGMAAGNLFGATPRVSLRKANAALCMSNSAAVTLDVEADNSNQGDAEITGTATVTPSGGYALFSGATMQRAGTAFTINATQEGVASPDSNTFNVTALAINKLMWDQIPLSSPTSATILPSPTVRTTDVYGNWVSSNQSIVLSLQDNTEGATLSGTLTKTAVGGVATFSNLKVTVSGSYYVRATTATYGTVNSPFFDILSITPVNTVSSIEMLQGPYFGVVGSSSVSKRSQIQLGTNFVDGTTAYKWKVVATNTSATTAASITLRAGTSTKNTISVPANTLVPTLFTSTISNANITSTSTWVMRPAATTLKIHSAKIVTTQTGATKTQQYIPLTSINVSATTAYLSTNSTTATQPSAINFPTFDWDPAEWNRIDSALLWVAYQSTVSGTSTCVTLWNKTTNAQIGGEFCGTTTTETTGSKSILASELPTSAAEIEVRFRTTNAANAVRLFKAGLFINQVSIVKTIAVQQVAGAASPLNTTSNFVDYRSTSYANQFGTATVNQYVSCRANATTSGSGSFIFKDHGTNTSGTTGTTISASTNIFSTQSSFTTLEAGAIATTDANNVYMNFAFTSGNFDLSNCLFTTKTAY